MERMDLEESSLSILSALERLISQFAKRNSALVSIEFDNIHFIAEAVNYKSVDI